MQTILGAGGAIGKPLAKALKEYTQAIRLVSRHPERVNPDDELVFADLTRADEVDRAVAGSEVAYVVVGFPYKLKVWQETWPPFMRNVIKACKSNGTKLVFFDNMYMYDKGHLNGMTEETPINPPSKKGQVRAEVARLVTDTFPNGDLEALIARAPDFLDGKNSIVSELVLKNLKGGSTANWFVDLDKLHTFIYTEDAARATARLGNSPEAYRQVWHLPTDHKPRTGRQWIELFAKELGAKPKMRTLPVWLLRVMGWFMPIMRELPEMAYQYDRDYVFDSSKYEKAFGEKATPVEEAVKAICH